MVDKRLHKKTEGLLGEWIEPILHDVAGADIVLAGFGSTYGAMKEAAGSAKEKKIGIVHFSQVWPLDAGKLRRIFSGAKRIITVEGNATGQLAGLMRREAGIEAKGSILRYDGRPFDVDYLKERLMKEIG
jgi:2-oxoglutarate ferredoxin oxidoreductase subunit alpha